MRRALRLPGGALRRGDGITEMYEKTRAEGFGAEVAPARVMVGTYVSSRQVTTMPTTTRARKVRTLISRISRPYSTTAVDAIPDTRDPLGGFALGQKFDDPVQMYLNDVFTVTVNLAGLPGLAVPRGSTRRACPLGLQLIGQAVGRKARCSTSAYRPLEQAAGFVAGNPRNGGNVLRKR